MLGVARRPGSSELEEYFWEHLVKLIVWQSHPARTCKNEANKTAIAEPWQKVQSPGNSTGIFDKAFLLALSWFFWFPIWHFYGLLGTLSN